MLAQLHNSNRQHNAKIFKQNITSDKMFFFSQIFIIKLQYLTLAKHSLYNT